MKILLDECVTKKLKAYLLEFDVQSVTEMGWNGLKNGKLLQAAVNEQFDILLTIDKNLQYQQNFIQYDITLVVLDVAMSKLSYLLELLPLFKKQIPTFQKKTVYRIGKDSL